MLVKITNKSLLAGAAVLLASGPSNLYGASAGTLRKGPDLKLADNDALKKDDEDAGALDDVFATKKRNKDDEITANTNGNSKATNTLTLVKGSDVKEKVDTNDAEAKKENQDIRVLIDHVFTNTKKKDHVATIAKTGSKATTTITKEESTDGTLKDLNSMKEVESDVVTSVMAKKDIKDNSGMVLSDGKSNVMKDDSIMPNMVKQDSGIIPRSLHDDSLPAKMNLRRIYYPFHAKNTNKYSDDQLYRMLASCTGSGACMNSNSSCFKDRSCSGNFSCSDSPNLLAEEDACSGPQSCSSSPGLAVGMGSCTNFQSCFLSPNGCIGQGSCSSQEEYGECSRSPGIFVGDDSCMERNACSYSPGATIKQSSCRERAACLYSPNITVDKYSCRERMACQRSPGATIGKYACNCISCCRFLNETCMIPDFQCNGGDQGHCSYSSGNLGCPDFSDLN